MTTIIDGKAHANRIFDEVKCRIQNISGQPPTLCVVLVGDDPASAIYVRRKEAACHAVGIQSRTQRYPSTITQDELLSHIQDVNNDSSVHGILIQMPLPSSICTNTILRAVHPLKDVDGLHPHNLGQLFAHTPTLVPCTPKGCLSLIKSVTDISGKHAVVVGRSLLVGRPMASLLLQNDATVTMAHRYTQHLQAITQQADILVVATGQPSFITRDHIKPGSVVIDVGITRLENKIVGDVDFDAVQDLCSAITPVPGGVGPMTVASLMENVWLAYEMQGLL